MNGCRNLLLNYLSVATTSTIKVRSIFISYLSGEKVVINENISLLFKKELSPTWISDTMISMIVYDLNHSYTATRTHASSTEH